MQRLPVPAETPRRLTPQAVISPLSSNPELRRRLIPPQNQPQNIQPGMMPPGVSTPNIRPMNQPPNISFQSNARIINPTAIGLRK